MSRRFCLLAALVLLAIALAACSQEETAMQDGYYTAEEAGYDSQGWKKFLTIYVSDGRIVTAEYNAKDRSGFIKSWDMDYMRSMLDSAGTYPNEYVRSYAEALLSRQNTVEVDVVSGATHSHETFQMLAEAAVAQAVAGDTSVVYIQLPDLEF